MAAREKRIFTGMEADRNEEAAECSLYQGQERLNELLPVKRTEKKYKIFPASS